MTPSDSAPHAAVSAPVPRPRQLVLAATLLLAWNLVLAYLAFAG